MRAEHDFFAPQRPRADPPAVFLLRAICHDWPDARVVHILARLRAAAGPQTALVLGDHVIPFACADDRRYGDIPGAVAQLAEGEGGLLANLGRAHANAYWLDISVRALFISPQAYDPNDALFSLRICLPLTTSDASHVQWAGTHARTHRHAHARCGLDGCPREQSRVLAFCVRGLYARACGGAGGWR